MDRFLRSLACVAVAVGGLAGSGVRAPALAWNHGGVFVGVGVLPLPFVPPPVYYPPAYYAPPPAYLPPPPAYPPPSYASPTYTPPDDLAGPGGQSCYAGAYTCPLDVPTPAGSPCSCPANNGRAYGHSG